MVNAQLIADTHASIWSHQIAFSGRRLERRVLFLAVLVLRGMQMSDENMWMIQ